MKINRKNFKEIFSGKGSKSWYILGGAVVCILIMSGTRIISDYTSSDKYCISCHIHPEQDQNWKLSKHYNNKAGVVVHCVECHLPPKDNGYLFSKAKHGIKDAYGFYFKDSTEINWSAKKLLENAKGFVYEKSCVRCHQNLFPATLSVNGSNAHLQYTNSKEDQRALCINCHLNVGHWDKNNIHAHDTGFGVTETKAMEIFTEPTNVSKLENFTEKVPGTALSFEMVAIPSGKFKMGSPNNEPLRKADEGPVRNVKINGFWMAKIEVSWVEYLEFFKATASQGRKEGAVSREVKTDAITGPTPPWGAPDQGWGKGLRPAITMSWKAANTYCSWLSLKTGKKYRLPTEAEWEYACRGGTTNPYFFEGDPKKFTANGWIRKLLGPDTTMISRYVNYKENSLSRTADPTMVKENPFGLKNMLGNVAEFCSDIYSPSTYKEHGGDLIMNPSGAETGEEHVIRGGSFKSDAKDLRCASRDFTKTKNWLITDPQMPKSIWWYSDSNDVGFRVVCEADNSIVGQ